MKLKDLLMPGIIIVSIFYIAIAINSPVIEIEASKEASVYCLFFPSSSRCIQERSTCDGRWVRVFVADSKTGKSIDCSEYYVSQETIQEGPHHTTFAPTLFCPDGYLSPLSTYKFTVSEFDSFGTGPGEFITERTIKIPCESIYIVNLEVN